MFQCSQEYGDKQQLESNGDQAAALVHCDAVMPLPVKYITASANATMFSVPRQYQLRGSLISTFRDGETESLRAA